MSLDKRIIKMLSPLTVIHFVILMMALIELLELKGNIITADAMHCLKKVTKAVSKKDGDYLLQVKNNQGKLNKEIQAYYHKIRREQPSLIQQNSYETVNDGHGQIEQRTYTQLPVTDWLEQRHGWVNFNSIVEVVRQRYVGDSHATETSYYISSLGINTEQVAKSIHQLGG